MERCDAFRPDDTLVVVAGFDDGAQQAADADPVAAHMHRGLLSVGALHDRAHRLGILCSEIENLAHLDTARTAAALFGDLVEDRLVMGLVGAGVARSELLEDRLALGTVIIIDVAVAEFQIRDLAVVENLAFAGFGQHQEFVRIVTADWPGIGAHRDRLKPHPLIGAQVADQVAIVSVKRVFFRQIKVIAVLHEELAAPHHAEAGTDFVAELPLDLVHRQGQVAVAVDVAAEDVGDQFLGRGRVEHVAVMPVADAQHLLPVIVVAPAFAPEFG